MSMISEQVKRLRKLANQWKQNDVAGFNLIFEAADTIEVLSAKVRAEDRPTGWIPVSERLPKEYAQYLACFKNGECYVYWLEDSDWSRSIIELEEIVAWMPLPEPYKGGDKE